MQWLRQRFEKEGLGQESTPIRGAGHPATQLRLRLVPPFQEEEQENVKGARAPASATSGTATSTSTSIGDSNPSFDTTSTPVEGQTKQVSARDITASFSEFSSEPRQVFDEFEDDCGPYSPTTSSSFCSCG